MAWKSGSESNPFQFAASLKGHTRSVVSFTVGANKLYSGSMDLTIKVSWDDLSFYYHMLVRDDGNCNLMRFMGICSFIFCNTKFINFINVFSIAFFSGVGH